jgi:hypothetical protein
LTLDFDTKEVPTKHIARGNGGQGNRVGAW